jgi:hypothetical protein
MLASSTTGSSGPAATTSPLARHPSIYRHHHNQARHSPLPSTSAPRCRSSPYFSCYMYRQMARTKPLLFTSPLLDFPSNLLPAKIHLASLSHSPSQFSPAVPKPERLGPFKLPLWNPSPCATTSPTVREFQRCDRRLWELASAFRERAVS